MACALPHPTPQPRAELSCFWQEQLSPVLDLGSAQGPGCDQVTGVFYRPFSYGKHGLKRNSSCAVETGGSLVLALTPATPVLTSSCAWQGPVCLHAQYLPEDPWA